MIRGMDLPSGGHIDVDIHGDGNVILLPVNPLPVEGAKADELRKWGVDPALGKRLIEGLRDVFRVVAFDYEGHLMAHPKPDSLTPELIADDVLAIADFVGADRFAYYGYSWLAMAGMQLALRTDRLSALAMGGFPPIDGPYEQMLAVTEATHRLTTTKPDTPAAPADSSAAPPVDADGYDWSAVDIPLSEGQTLQFVTLYRSLQDFDDRAAQHRLDIPRLCFVGSEDTIEYGQQWGGVTVSMAGALRANHEELERLGWEVRVLDGLDHTTAMQPTNVLTVIRHWFEDVVSGDRSGSRERA